VVYLVKARLEKARSFSRRRTREGIDIDLFTKIVMEKIGGETLGKFYRERILNRKDLKAMTLFKPRGEITIEHGLFGYRILSGRDYIECDSEEEARYLKVFIEAGMNEVEVPKDRCYLRTVLSELEVLKRKNDEIVDIYLSSISSKKIREKLRHEIWQKIMRGDQSAD